MNCSYDEDLKVNPFYKTLLDYEVDLENASKKEWIICIPRNGTIAEPITKCDINNHILVPNGTNTRFTTLNHLVVNITQNKIEIEDRDDYFSAIRILFNETFYHKHLRYKVYCIEFPLSRHFIQANPISQISNVRDCIDFLWIETYGREVLKRITESCHIYLAKCKFSNATCLKLEALKESIERLYRKCLQIPLECSKLEEKTQTDQMLLYNLRLATETFMQHSLNNQIFALICAITSQLDSNFNKITRNLQEIQMKHFQIANYQERIPTARCEMNKINQYITTLGKIRCLRATFNILSTPTSHANKIAEGEVLHTEIVVQLFAFLIIKLNVNNWIGNLMYMKEFVFSHCETHDEHSYLLTTLEAAIEYVKTGELFEKLNSDIDASQNNIVIDIRNCNLDKLKETFSTERVDTGHVQTHLCHPLCSCDECESLLMQTRTDVQTSFDFVDEKGRNCLHVACMYGYPQIVDFLLHKSIAFNNADYSASYPIHYTALRGHLNSMLLLLHSGADMNAINADGNTALHLAANNGHENCVKGLLYYSEHQNNTQLNVNWCNAWGESALHLASRWGYLNIVNILLEYEIDHRLRNKRNESAMDLAHNVAVKKLIVSFIKTIDNEYSDAVGGNAVAKSSSLGNIEFSCDNDAEVKSYGIRPKNFQQFKKADLLLKAIENNDLPLSCFYLGIPVSPNINNNNQMDRNPTATDGSNASFHCHPLCDCPLCTTTKAAAVHATSCQIKLNVNICNSEGFTPLHVAAQFGRNEILRLLLDAGADCNLQTYKAFYSPLHLACINQRVLAIKELLLSGSCNIDMQDGKGNTALHYACSKNDIRILDILLSKGADSSLKNNRGKTVLRLAQERSLFAVAKIIKEKGREINSSFENLL